MCDYFYVEFRCKHHNWLVRRWCPLYEINRKPCKPNYLDRSETWGHRLCGKCQPLSKSAEVVRQHFHLPIGDEDDD